MRNFRKSLKMLILAALTAVILAAAAYAADYTAENITEFYAAMHDGMAAQKETFAIEYSGELPRVSAPVALVRAMGAYYPNDDGNGADVLMMNVTEASYYRYENNVIFHMKYLLTPEQLAWVDSQVASIADELQLDGESDFVKIKRVYQYMGTHFTYDETLSKFSDYDGLTTGSMVCQGYSLLTYKLLWHCGVPCRIIVGTSHDEAHGWNIVKLDGVWYNLDTTWDSGEGDTMYWDYFMKNEQDFKNHVRDERFDSAAFHAACPMAEKSYDVHYLDILIDDTVFSGLTIRNGKSIQFGYALHPEDGKVNVTWTSSDSAVASITESGMLESLTPGKTTITATADDDSYLPGTFPVTAVDLRTCSPWADEALNSYYLRKLYPAPLCSDFQSPIHRDEYADLLRLLITDAVPPYQETRYFTSPTFNDLADSDYWYGVIFCAGRSILQGTGDKTFSPHSNLTREQAAKLLCNTLAFIGIPLRGEAELTFADTDKISPWAVPFVRQIVAAGIMEGTGENFDPQGTITREQCAVTLERLYTTYIEPAASDHAA